MTMDTVEFAIGDYVTYQPYGQPIDAVVLRIQFGMFGDGKRVDGSPDRRVFYVLGGGARVTTSGKCIRESQYFQPN